MWLASDYHEDGHKCFLWITWRKKYHWASWPGFQLTREPADQGSSWSGNQLTRVPTDQVPLQNGSKSTVDGGSCCGYTFCQVIDSFSDRACIIKQCYTCDIWWQVYQATCRLLVHWKRQVTDESTVSEQDGKLLARRDAEISLPVVLWQPQATHSTGPICVQHRGTPAADLFLGVRYESRFILRRTTIWVQCHEAAGAELWCVSFRWVKDWLFVIYYWNKKDDGTSWPRWTWRMVIETGEGRCEWMSE